MIPRTKWPMSQHLLIMAARLWGAIPSERLKTALVGPFGQRFLVGVWAVVFDEVGRVLIFRHTHDRAHPWGLPSGRLEARETPEQAVAREFHEEVGGSLRPTRLVRAHCEPDLPILRLAYLCDLEVPPVSPSVEVDRWGFFEFDNLPTSVRQAQRSTISMASNTSQPVLCRDAHI